MTTERPETEGDVSLEERQEVREPRRFAVLLLNDDYTTMEFVIEVLRRFFALTEERAMAVMLQVHQKGRGIAGVYSFEIAEMKAFQVVEYAKKSGFPLQADIEPVSIDP